MINITSNNRKWWIFFGMAAALSVVFLDQTAISVVLPLIQRDLQLSNVMLQWVINAYLVSLAALVIFGGKLGDVFGHKNIFLMGIVIFILSSLMCAEAQSGYGLIVSRGMQGVGGALMIPVTGVLIAHSFHEGERGRAMGLNIAVASIFLSLGPLLSGIIVYYFNWRWVFWINLPISLISIFLTVIAVPNLDQRDQEIQHNKPLDWLGFLTFSIFIVSLVIALMEGVNLGWNSIKIIFLFGISIIFGVMFIFVEKKAHDPIIHLGLFKERNFLAANICLLLFTCAFSASVFWAILLQNVMGYSAVYVGLFYLPVTFPIILMAPLGGRLKDKYGPRLPVIIGTILTAIGSFWIAIGVFYGNYLAIFPGFLLFGLGPPLIYAAVMSTTISSVPPSQMGMASGIANGIRQFGRVLGVAMMGGIINTIKPIFTFAFSMSMVFAGCLILCTLFISFLLPNKPNVSR